MTSSALLSQTATALDSICWPSEEARVWVSELVRGAADDPTVLAVVLYGSAVRKAARPGDIDLLVIHRAASPGADVRVDVDLR